MQASILPLMLDKAGLKTSQKALGRAERFLAGAKETQSAPGKQKEGQRGEMLKECGCTDLVVSTVMEHHEHCIYGQRNGGGVRLMRKCEADTNTLYTFSQNFAQRVLK